MLINPKPLLRKTKWYRYCIYLTTLNLNNFKVVEVMGLKVIASRFPAIASPPYKILSKSTNWLISYWGGGHADRHTDKHIKHADRLVIL
jgi:hypothetical protein